MDEASREEAMQRILGEFVERHSGPEHEPRPCPRAVADVILQILQTGVVSARAAGWSGRADLAAIEADHVHNLADLLRQYTLHKIRYYWDVERPSYVSAFTREMGKEPKMFLDHWQKLEPLVPKE